MCTLIITDHSAIDRDQVVRAGSLVVDTRNATAGVTDNREKIVRCQSRPFRSLHIPFFLSQQVKNLRPLGVGLSLLSRK